MVCVLKESLRPKSLTRYNLSVPNCRAIRRKPEDCDTTRLSKVRQGKSRDGGRVRTTDFPGPQPKPLAQKPNRKAAVLGWKCKCITIFTEHFATHVPTPNLEGQETVFVRPLPMDQPGMRDSVSVTRAPPSIAQWVAEVHKPPHHGKVQSLRDAVNVALTVSFEPLLLIPNEGLWFAELILLPHLKTAVGGDLRCLLIIKFVGEVTQWLGREFTGRKVRVSNLNSISRLPCLGLGNTTVSQPSSFLWVAWQLGTETVL
ncbi:hypothetical protein CSKR_108900 [Clonorchis sinensis]|uniref:Uncharacterized protein n=1 Tax=Clonorchis sinensis TaxID=79923 RepID=A0A3R7ELQ5_CLOSI|nr:hypothetical protein CSKR_108900 [Clonorchis sinensis]